METNQAPAQEIARKITLRTCGATVEAIKAATVNASELLGVDKETGTIEAGKAADIIAVDGDPLTDVRVLKAVKFVMARGEVIVSP